MGKENQATIYIKNGDVATYKLFQEVCEREGVSVSQKVIKLIYDYMASHGEGNPQTLLKYAGEVKTLPKWKTCEFSQKMRVKGEIYCSYSNRVMGKVPGWKLTSACTRCNVYEPEPSN